MRTVVREQTLQMLQRGKSGFYVAVCSTLVICTSLFIIPVALGSVNCDRDSVMFQYYQQVIKPGDREAMSTMLECLRSAPNELLDSAVIAFNDGNYQEVLSLLKRMPDQIQVSKTMKSSLLLMRGISHQHVGDYHSALQDFDLCGRDRGHECAVMLSAKSFCLNALHRFEEGLSCADSALAIVTGFASAWNNRGHSLNGLGRIEEASSCFDSSTAYDPTNAEAYNNKGMTKFHSGKLSRALAHIDRAIALDSGDARFWSNRGKILVALVRYDEALASYDRSLKLDPTNPSVWSEHGALLFGLGRNVEALASLDSSISYGNETSGAFAFRGKILGALRRYFEANHSLERALAIDHANAEAWLGKSFMLMELGDAYLLDVWNSLDSAVFYDSSLTETGRGIQQELLKALDRHGKKVEGINK